VCGPTGWSRSESTVSGRGSSQQRSKADGEAEGGHES
jgi:hypothetical protein